MASPSSGIGRAEALPHPPPPTRPASPPSSPAQARVGDRVETARTSRLEAALGAAPAGGARLGAEQRAFVERTLRGHIAAALEGAASGREIHRHHMDEVRGVAGTISDWLSDVLPPHIGIWHIAKLQLQRAQAALDAGDPQAALQAYELGAQLLAEARATWAAYVDLSAEGAGATADTLGYVRDGAIVTVAALLSGGAAYGALGGGALATTGASATGVAAGAGAGALLPTELGEDVRGTLSEARQAGLRHNLALARSGLVGLLRGTGAGLEATLQALQTLFTDPAQLAEDLAGLPAVLEQLIENRETLIAAFERLPPERQAEAVGAFAGHLEAMIITAAATEAAFAAAGDTIAAAGGGGGAGGTLITPEGFRVFAVEVAAGVSADARAAAAASWGPSAGGPLAAGGGGVSLANASDEIPSSGKPSEGTKVQGAKAEEPQAEGAKVEGPAVENPALTNPRLKWGNPKSKPTYGHTFLDHGQRQRAVDLANRARDLRHQVGAFTDDQAAAERIADLARRLGPGTHDAPLDGLGSRAFLPDGSEVVPDTLRVVVKPDGSVRTAFPYDSAHPTTAPKP